MTRVNLVPPEELHDQHLFAEYRELKMVPKSLARSIAARGVPGVQRMIPPAYVLGTGHVSFFYDKGLYLAKRYTLLRAELDRRAYAYNADSELDPDGVFRRYPQLNNDWTPTAEALALVRDRIQSRVAMKPQWYRMTVT